MKKQITEEQITELMQAFSRAEEVDKLRVEIEGLRAQLDERYIAMRVRQLEEALDVERQTARRLRAKIEKLREALEPFRCYCDAGQCVEYGERHASICEKGAARNVLEGESHA